MDFLQLEEISKRNIDLLKERKSEIKGFYKRNIFEVLNLNSNVVMIGLRRIGKTEILNEIAIKNKSKDIFYLKLDSSEFATLNNEELKNLPTLIKNYVVQFKVQIVLLDEIQVLNKWNYLIKDIFDTMDKKVKVFATGSNSNELMKSIELGVGRFMPLIYGVLSFREMKNIEPKITLENYIDFMHFPIYKNRLTYDEEVHLSVVERVFLASQYKKQTLYKILRSIVEKVGHELNKNRISGHSQVAKTHLESYLDSLKNGQLIYELKNISRKNSNSKFYPLIPGLLRIMTGKNFDSLDEKTKGSLFEQFVFIQLLCYKSSIPERFLFHYTREKSKNKISEIDFVYKYKGIETKYSEKITNINEYALLAKKNNLTHLDFIYIGETKREMTIEGIKIKIWNWKEFNYKI